MDEDDEECFSVTFSSKDVYDLAADIASEFESVASTCGHELLDPLVYKVITALEHLETVVNRLLAANDYITSLREQISQLQISKVTNAENKMKLEQDLADVEESWIAEITDLKCSLSRAQDDNRHLQNLLKEQLSLEHSTELIPDAHLTQELQEIIAALNSRLNDKDALLERQISDINILKSSLEQQHEKNKLLQLKINESQGRVKALCQDKAGLKMAIQKQEEMLKVMQHELVCSESHKKDSQLIQTSIQPLSLELKEKMLQEELLNRYQQEHEALLLQINHLQHKLNFAEHEVKEYKMKCASNNKVHRWQSLSNKGSAIRQLFWYFLGVVGGEGGNFRS